MVGELCLEHRPFPGGKGYREQTPASTSQEGSTAPEHCWHLRPTISASVSAGLAQRGHWHQKPYCDLSIKRLCCVVISPTWMSPVH